MITYKSQSFDHLKAVFSQSEEGEINKLRTGKIEYFGSQKTVLYVLMLKMSLGRMNRGSPVGPLKLRNMYKNMLELRSPVTNMHKFLRPDNGTFRPYKVLFTRDILTHNIAIKNIFEPWISKGRGKLLTKHELP